MKKRLDLLMVERALAPSREKAKAYIMSGDVYVDGQKEDKAGTMFKETVKIEVRGNTLPYVSRGGLKLEKAMNNFMEKNGVDLFVLMITDIIENNSQILVLGKQEIAEKAFNVKLENNSAFLPGVVSRKKQIVPQIDSVL